ncbi:MAG: cation:proton antiporter [Minwuia sp.]|uniref:cation:proton antiporter domain-containing protein n=1 Tax=Minwuia sp. TaxID=2493630 RepID=UPI003A8396ED
MHEAELIGLAIVAGAAMMMGVLFSRIRQPVVVGYIVAGVVLGPSVLAIIPSREDVGLIAEMGVLMLLFLIGMELSLRNFRRIWRLAVTVMALQLALGLVFAFGMGTTLEWGIELSLIVGFGLSLSSTAVAIKILDDIGQLRTEVGRLAVGVLIAQDLAVVPMLIIVSEMGRESGSLYSAIIPVVVAVVILIGIVYLLSRRKREHLPFGHWITHHADLAAMAGLALCFIGSAISGLIGLSPAYGAFVAGLVVGNTTERSKMIAAVQPVQSVLLMVFFLSIGLLLNLDFIADNWGVVLALLLVVTVTKTAANIGIFRMLGEPWPRAWLAGTVLGQVGEFSFVLVAAGLAAGIIDTFGGNLMTSVIVLSLASSSLVLFTARRMATVRWRRVRTFEEVIGAVYGRRAGKVVVTPARAARSAGRVSLTLGDYSRGEVDRLMKRIRPAKPFRPEAPPATEQGWDDAAMQPKPEDAPKDAPEGGAGTDPDDRPRGGN